MSEPLLGHHSSSDSGPAKKTDRRKQTILIIVGIVGVALTYLLYRHSVASGTSTSTAYTPGTSPDGTGGDTSGSGSDYSGVLNAVGSQLSSLASQNQTLMGDYSSLQSQLASNHSQSSSSVEEDINKKLDQITPGRGGTTTSAQTSQYFIDYDKATGKYYDINPFKRTIHLLTDAQLGADKAAGAVIKTVQGTPKYTAGGILQVAKTANSKTTSKQATAKNVKKPSKKASKT